MAETVNLNLRLPADLHGRLREMADADLRSLNAEIVWLLDRAATSQDRADQVRTEEGTS